MSQRQIRKPSAAGARRSLGIAAVFGLMWSMGGCATSPLLTEDQAVEVTREFLREYDRYAQDGFPLEVPTGLATVAEDGVLDLVRQDALWYNELGYHQNGDTKIVDLTVVSAKSDKASVRVVTDTSGVEYTDPDGVVDLGPETRQVLRIDVVLRGDAAVVAAITVMSELAE